MVRCAVLVALACLLALLFYDVALAQSGPFGIPRQPVGPPPDGITGWILAKQAEFYQTFSRQIRDVAADPAAIWVLLIGCFLYGVFHAAGPGHGKAVISSYLVANEETARRGIVLSFASALLQALVAVALVAVLAWLLSSTAKTMCSAEKAIEIASYALIAAFGARLVWTKGGGFMRALQAKPAPAMAAAHHHHDHDHGHDHGHHHHDHHHHDHAREREHDRGGGDGGDHGHDRDHDDDAPPPSPGPASLAARA